MDGGVWQKTMKGHVYTYMQGEEDYEKNTNLTSTYLIISECFNLYTVLWMSVSSSAFSPFLVIRPSIICRDQVARGHVCIKDLPRCGSCLEDQLVGMGSSLASLLPTTARLLVWIGEASGNFFLGAGKVASMRRRRRMLDTFIPVFQCRSKLFFCYHAYIGLGCLHCLSFTHD